jgi:hypothetical protein
MGRTLLEFVKAEFSESWERYKLFRAASARPRRNERTLPVAVVEHLWPETKQAADKAGIAYRDIVDQLKAILDRYVVVADDPNHRPVVLDRRHWVDAAIDVEESTIRHGDQLWTNVEVNQEAPGARRSYRNVKPSISRAIDDSAHTDAFLRARERNPKLSVRAYVLEHYGEIEGPNLEAKVRRLQKRIQDLN